MPPAVLDCLPVAADVAAARRRLAGIAVRTPLITHPALDERVGGRVLLKAENLQRTGSFKIRGAYNCVAQVDRARHPGGVVAFSSGNHAQGVALAARLAGMQALLAMPMDAPALKIERTRASGAEVHLYDRATTDRDALVARLASERRAALVHAYDDARVIAGQGTVGAEIMEQAGEIALQSGAAAPRLDAVIVPCSGGGFAAGVSLAVKDVSPATGVYTAEPAGFDDMARSLASGRRERNASLAGSICDALLSAMPGEITFAVARQTLAGGLVVSDAEAADAVRFAFRELKLVLEPGGAVALAAVLQGRLPVRDRTTVVVLSGGNADAATFARLVAV